jgi:CRP/FNR family transcriptional regulator, anaerobic regulatory protein
MLAQAADTRELNPAPFRPGFEYGARMMSSSAHGSCSGCRLQELCLPSGLSEGSLKEFASVVLPHRRLKAGQALFRSGEIFDAVYLVRTGFVKTVVLLEDGREQVTALHMPGEMLGMDGLASGRHASDAIALDDSEICVVPYDRLETLSCEAREVQRHLHRMFSNEIVREQRMMLLLGSMRAEERVSAFLLNLSERLTARGYSPSDFVLRLTREEIGSLLGMKLETVSRIFSKFQKAELIEIDGKHVRIVSIEGLRTVVGR